MCRKDVAPFGEVLISAGSGGSEEGSGQAGTMG